MENKKINLETEKNTPHKEKKKHKLLIWLLLLLLLLVAVAVAPLLGRQESGSPNIDKTVKQAAYTFKGYGATVGGTLEVYLNGEKVQEMLPDFDGSFVLNLVLVKGENIIEVYETLPGGERRLVYREKILYDPQAPSLEIYSPKDDSQINQNSTVVKGKTDNGEVKIIVNNNNVTVQEDGTFETNIVLKAGENTITVVADNGSAQTKEEINVEVANPNGQSQESQNNGSGSNNGTGDNTGSGDQNSNSSNSEGNNGGNSDSQPEPEPIILYPSKVIISFIKYSSDATNGDSEYLEVRNTGEENKNLTGWYIHDADGNIFVFPQFTLNAGQTVRINTNKDGFSFLTKDGKSVWDRVGEPAYLKNVDGQLIDIYSY